MLVNTNKIDLITFSRNRHKTLEFLFPLVAYLK